MVESPLVSRRWLPTSRPSLAARPCRLSSPAAHEATWTCITVHIMTRHTTQQCHGFPSSWDPHMREQQHEAPSPPPSLSVAIRSLSRFSFVAPLAALPTSPIPLLGQNSTEPYPTPAPCIAQLLQWRRIHARKQLLVTHYPPLLLHVPCIHACLIRPPARFPIALSTSQPKARSIRPENLCHP